LDEKQGFSSLGVLLTATPRLQGVESLLFGRGTLDLFDLGSPSLDWPRLAGAMGVEAARAETLDQFADLLRVSYRQNGPFLIELVIL
jgi:thiamine pyrophosphate-dependent acetolactate synthase large subunit-like protein